MTEETIVAAAIRVATTEARRTAMWMEKRCYPDHLTLTAPPPARHHTLLHIAHDLGLGATGPADQGFVTSTGRYVGREEAFRIAEDAGQPFLKPGGHSKGHLFSEDLW